MNDAPYTAEHVDMPHIRRTFMALGASRAECRDLCQQVQESWGAFWQEMAEKYTQTPLGFNACLKDRITQYRGRDVGDEYRGR